MPQPGPNVNGTPARGRIGGLEPLGRYDVGLTSLTAAAWDGRHIWLVDQEGRLRAVDPASGQVVVDRALDVPPFSGPGLTPTGGELVGIGRDGAGTVHLVRIDTGSGTSSSLRIDEGLPLGRAAVIDGSLVVADYGRGVVAVDVRTAATRVLVDPGLTADLLQPGPAGTFWLVDDRRERVVRVSEDRRLLVDERRPRYVHALASDGGGNAWLAEGTTVTVVEPTGGVREFAGFTNAARLLRCGAAVIVSDVETGEVAALAAGAAPRRLATGAPGAAVSCADDGVWYLTPDGYLVRLPIPQ